MSWTTVVDLFMDEYQTNSIIDKSDFGNHGHLMGAVTTQTGFVVYNDLDAQIEIPVRNNSLNRFEGLRVQALVKPNPFIRRYNLVEGWMSFALVIQPNGQLVGTIYDGQQWIGPDSGTNLLTPNAWNRVAFEFDGISRATLKIEEAIVGSRDDMPLGIAQPNQVITLGHWPRGDDRYTLSGALGHVRIEKRDPEDYIRDAQRLIFCKRKLSDLQMDAYREMWYLYDTLSSPEQEALERCARTQARAIRELIREMRSWGTRGRVRLFQLAGLLKNAWCCLYDGNQIRKLLIEYFAEVGDHVSKEQKEKFLHSVQEFFNLSNQCNRSGYPYDRMRQLFFVLFPELTNYEKDIKELIDQSQS